jgi:hypothetical protein
VATSYCPGPGSLAAVYIFHSTSLLGLAVLCSAGVTLRCNLNRRCSSHLNLPPPPERSGSVLYPPGPGICEARNLQAASHAKHRAPLASDDSAHGPFHVALGLGRAELAAPSAELIVRHYPRTSAACACALTEISSAVRVLPGCGRGLQ